MGFVARFSRVEGVGQAYEASYGKGSKKKTAVLRTDDNGLWGVFDGFASAGMIPKSKKLKDVKEAWGAAAEAAYGAVDTPKTATTAPAGPPALRPPGPPSLKTAAGVAPKPPVIPPPKVTTIAEGKDVGGPPRLRSSAVFDDTFGEGFPEKIEPPPLADEGTASCPECGQPMHGWTEDREYHRTLPRYLPPCRCGAHAVPGYEPDPLDPRMFKTTVDGEGKRINELSPLGAMDLVYAWMCQNREYVMTNGRLDEPWASIQESLYRVTGYKEYRPEVWGSVQG